MPSTDIAHLSFEQAFSELETIVAALESNQSALEEATTLFERGQDLAQHCAALLDQAELKVHQITGETADISSLEDSPEEG
jgi:exodeoxyribonuclease VII small subunit